jgi:hypothetical protein
MIAVKLHNLRRSSDRGYPSEPSEMRDQPSGQPLQIHKTLHLATWLAGSSQFPGNSRKNLEIWKWPLIIDVTQNYFL